MTISVDAAMLLWNVILTLVLVPVAWVLVHLNARITSVDEKSATTADRIWKSIAEHREDIPKTYVTKADLQTTQNQIMQRFDRLEEKIDRVMGTRNG